MLRLGWVSNARPKDEGKTIAGHHDDSVLSMDGKRSLTTSLFGESLGILTTVTSQRSLDKNFRKENVQPREIFRCNPDTHVSGEYRQKQPFRVRDTPLHSASSTRACEASRRVCVCMRALPPRRPSLALSDSSVAFPRNDPGDHGPPPFTALYVHIFGHQSGALSFGYACDRANNPEK